MVSTNNKRASQPDTKAQRNTLKVLDTANIANFRQLANSKVGPDARTLKEMCPRCHQKWPKRRFSSTKSTVPNGTVFHSECNRSSKTFDGFESLKKGLILHQSLHVVLVLKP